MEKNEDKKPWDDSFSDNLNQKGNLSRVELRKQKGNFKLILAVLISIIALIAIFSLAFGMSKQGSLQHNQINSAKKAKKTSEPRKKASHRQVTAEKKSKAKTNDDIKAKTSQTSVSSNSEDPDSTQSSSNNNDQSSENTNNSGDAEYVTVNQSEGIYRVAKNAGISVSELQSMNGLNDSSVITPGQKLRIK